MSVNLGPEGSNPHSFPSISILLPIDPSLIALQWLHTYLLSFLTQRLTVCTPVSCSCTCLLPPHADSHVASHNTHVTLAEKLQLVLSHGTHYCHFHKTSEIPGTSVLCSNSDVIKSRPCFLFSISLASCSCPISSFLCPPFMYTLHCCVPSHTSDIPD